MEFDKSRVYTSVNADEVKVGSKGYFADNIAELQRCVFNEDKDYFFTIKEIATDDENYRFLADNYSGNEASWNLFYLVEEPKEKELRPYRDSDEMVEDFKKRFNVKVPPYEMPLIWIKIKDTDKKYLIVRFASALTICHNVEVYTPTLEDLVEGYTYLDGSPCGIEEENEKSKI